MIKPQLSSLQPHSTYKLRYISLIVTVGGFLMGLEITSLSVFITNDDFIKHLNYPSPMVQGMLVGANVFGGLIGCLLYGLLVTKFSRIRTFQIGTYIWIKGTVLGILPTNVWLIVFSRVFKGITTGMYSVLLAAYTAEVFPMEKRGRVMAFVQLSNSSAMLIMHYAAFGSLKLKPQISYRLVWALEIIPALVLCVSTLWLPESPQWLTQKGQYTKAQQIQNDLAMTYNKQYPKRKPIPLLHKLDLASLYGDISNKSKSAINGKSWKPILMGSALQLLVQFSGINILLYYITYICEMVGFGTNVKYVTASIPYFINMVLTVVPVTFIDKVSRKKFTLAGSFPLGFIMISIGLIMKFTGHEVEPIHGNQSLIWNVTVAGGNWIMLLCFLFVSIFAITLSCVPWLYTNELLPISVKAKGMPICMAVGWSTNFAITLLGPLMLKYLKWGLFILLGGLTLLMSVIIAVFYPDTKKLTTEDIDNLFDNNGCEQFEKELYDSHTDSFNLSGGSGQPIQLVEEEITKVKPQVVDV